MSWGRILCQLHKTKDIAENQQQQFICFLSKAQYFSFLMDGSTDIGNVEDEVVALVYHTKDDATEEIKSCARYFSVQVPEKADADGLVRCFGSTLCELGNENVRVLDQASDLGAYGSRSILLRGEPPEPLLTLPSRMG